MMRSLVVLGVALAGMAQAQVVAEIDGYQLTQDDLVMGVSTAAFLSGVMPTEDEIGVMVADFVAEFEEDPALFEAGVEVVEQIYTNARNAEDPAFVSAYRLELLTLFYGLTLEMPRDDWGAMVRYVFDTNPVLAYDPESFMILTQNDLRSAVQYMYFVQGQAFPTEEDTARYDEVLEVESAITELFAEITPEQQLFLVTAGIYWPILEANLANLSADQQAQLAQSYQTSAQQSGVAQPLPDWGQESLDPETASFLSRLSLGNHVSMMNGIEAMGGSNDYWELRPAGW